MNAERHLRWSIALGALFVGTGLGLEALLGLRISGWVEDTQRRELVVLGHAHGGLLVLFNIAIGWSLERLQTPVGWADQIRRASWGAAVLVGAGFIGGGLWHGPTDPGLMILMVPAGALLLLSSMIAVVVLRSTHDR